jgi:sensor histidine kinase YesM
MKRNRKWIDMSTIASSSLDEQRLKGAKLMVYFRWVFISMLCILLGFQYFSGYRGESGHAMVLISIYAFCNLLLWYMAHKKSDPAWVGYISVLIDLSIVFFHLWYLTSNFDYMAVTAAATTFLIPVLFILYTFRNDQRLLIFNIIVAVIGFNGIYYYHYWGSPEPYEISLSLSPLSHGFKTMYILFIGLLCVYLQYSIKGFIEKQIDITRKQTESESMVRIAQEKSHHATLLKVQAEAQNLLLEKEVKEKEPIAEDLKRSRLELEEINKSLEQTIADRTRALTDANTQLLKLEKENLQSQFDVLKQQVNPHFLFNSLNVLTSLIRIDQNLAETFTERLAKVYRYVLENKDKDLITLSTEMDFLHAYLFLIRMRFEEKVVVTIDLPGNHEELYVLPLALQLLIENAIKHNMFSRVSPLFITLTRENDDYLRVENNLQSRDTQLPSTGIGLSNIARRYELLTDKPARFEITLTHFIARIPLLQKDIKHPNLYESSDR